MPFNRITVRADRPSSSFRCQRAGKREGWVESQPLLKASRMVPEPKRRQQGQTHLLQGSQPASGWWRLQQTLNIPSCSRSAEKQPISSTRRTIIGGSRLACSRDPNKCSCSQLGVMMTERSKMVIPLDAILRRPARTRCEKLGTPRASSFQSFLGLPLPSKPNIVRGLRVHAALLLLEREGIKGQEEGEFVV